MAIVKLTSPQAAPADTSDWVASVSLLEKLYIGRRIKLDLDNDLVKEGTLMQIGGSVYLATSDTEITGTKSQFVKIIPGVSSATAEYISSLSGVSWNETYNGYYDISGNLYLFAKAITIDSDTVIGNLSENYVYIVNVSDNSEIEITLPDSKKNIDIEIKIIVEKGSANIKTFGTYGSQKIGSFYTKKISLYSIENFIEIKSDGNNWVLMNNIENKFVKNSNVNRFFSSDTTGVDSSYISVAWSKELNLIAAVSSGSGYVLTSNDGLFFNHISLPTNNNWWAICWSPDLSLFCAVCDFESSLTNNILLSSDGINWSVTPSPANYNWTSVCWSPELSLFCAVARSGTGDRVMTSPDGTNWTMRTSAADYDWTSVCWSPELSLFCAVADSGTGDRVMTSPDGINWTIRTSAADNNWRSVCWSPELSLFCAVASSGTGDRVMTSPDGINWTLRTSAADNNWQSVCWSPELSLFCAVANSGTGNRVMTSSDGIIWGLRASSADNSWRSVCWSPELSLFCAVAVSGTGNRVMTSI